MALVRIKIYLNRCFGFSKTKQRCEDLGDFFVREQFMYPARGIWLCIMRMIILRYLESVGSEAGLNLLAPRQNLCDQPRISTQAGARPVMDSVRPRVPEKTLQCSTCKGA
ncbi:hypothetical protein PoB_000067400 [Plakobranchus ocellatus]|uniref:Uncharacterized protein n=1 Tax=Plakobranchus ocellatus TaxID=259542 RepID=A0AAV3XWM6_9GAST|nr:hypothetical protein PoB_000067400 [Plakobranchus ocellatus]